MSGLINTRNGSLFDEEKDWEGEALIGDSASPRLSLSKERPLSASSSPPTSPRPRSPSFSRPSGVSNSPPPPSTVSAITFWISLIVNCAATVGIVLVNQSVLRNPTLRGAPVTFVSYHFFLTAVTLHIASNRHFRLFERKGEWMPQISLALVFAGRTVLTNWSLALLPVAIYQELRILVTPATVLINFFAYRKTVTSTSLMTLAVVCFGIGLSVWADTHKTPVMPATPVPEASHPAISARAPSTSGIDDLFTSASVQLVGYVFGFAGVFLSSLYSILINVYLPKFQLSSLQLLYLQSPLGCAFLLAMSPFFDTYPNWSKVTTHEYSLVFLSGLCAVLINVSQFYIVAGSSALSSTVVGHFKTCLIVVGGWITTTEAIAWDSALGVGIAMVGIVLYTTYGL